MKPYKKPVVSSRYKNIKVPKEFFSFLHNKVVERVFAFLISDILTLHSYSTLSRRLSHLLNHSPSLAAQIQTLSGKASQPPMTIA